MINWKRSKRYWLHVYQSKPEYVSTPEKIKEAEDFVKKYASKIRWAKTICELGISDGKHLKYFMEKYPTKKYYGNDFYPELYEFVQKSYPEVAEKCDISLLSTDKYLKKCIRYVDAIFTYNHLMYISDGEIDKICSKISDRVGKYLLLREIYTPVKYDDLNQNAFLSFGFGRDYQNMFYEFELKIRDIEVVNINNKEVEFHTYLLKRIG